MIERLIKWLCEVLWKTKCGHNEMIHLHVKEMGSRRGEKKKQAAKERLAKNPNALFGPGKKK